MYMNEVRQHQMCIAFPKSVQAPYFWRSFQGLDWNPLSSNRSRQSYPETPRSALPHARGHFRMVVIDSWLNECHKTLIMPRPCLLALTVLPDSVCVCANPHSPANPSAAKYPCTRRPHPLLSRGSFQPVDTSSPARISHNVDQAATAASPVDRVRPSSHCQLFFLPVLCAMRSGFAYQPSPPSIG